MNDKIASIMVRMIVVQINTKKQTQYFFVESTAFVNQKTHLLSGRLALLVFLSCDEQLLDHLVDLELALHGVQQLSAEYVEASAGTGSSEKNENRPDISELLAATTSHCSAADHSLRQAPSER
jgi:hypothetical protein